MVQKSSMSRTPSTSTQEIQMDMFDHHPHTQVREHTRKTQCDENAKRPHELCHVHAKEASERGCFTSED